VPMTSMLLGLALGAATVQAPPSLLDVGPAIGAAIPRFEARDQAGRLRTFDDLKGPNGLMLVFVRSADW
jgi:hypothetical protein